VLWRGRTELPPALRGAKAALARTALRPWFTERAFGLEGRGALPALELKTPKGRTVVFRGKIDRVDLVKDGNVAVLFDYKRSAGRRLRLEEVFHGLALQLLSYLLVLRDLAIAPDGAKIVPGGAFYLPLLAGLHRVDDPAKSAEDPEAPLRAFQPRGIVDFDALSMLDPTFANGWSPAFKVFRKKEDGASGHQNHSDAVSSTQLPRILEFVRRKLGELSDRWLDGDIEVRPARLGSNLPCARCVYRSVCRFEFAQRQMNLLEPINRAEAIQRMSDEVADG
jgi:ATP-dependent helicase/nuclease subunit B